jgi:hypothetical protein
LIRMSSTKDEDEKTIRHKRRLAEFLDNDENNNGDFSPPAKVQKLQERVVIWSKSNFMDPLKVGKGWKKVPN